LLIVFKSPLNFDLPSLVFAILLRKMVELIAKIERVYDRLENS
jgi:hypothetical protein